MGPLKHPILFGIVRRITARRQSIVRRGIGSGPNGCYKHLRQSIRSSGPNETILQGVEWLLPKDTFDILGGRVSGSVAVTFMEAMPSDHVGRAELASGKMLARAHIALRTGGNFHIPEPTISDGYLDLPLAPTRSGP